MAGTILLGFDVECASEHSVGFARQATDLLQRLGAPCTWYVTGMTLERYADLFREIQEHELIELQAHTYSHLLLKTVLIEVPEGRVVHGSSDWFMKPGASLEEIDEDLGRCQDVFQDVLGRRATALTGPWCYYRGLADRPDVLEIVDRRGFKALRTFGRNERDGNPVPLDWQPFFYDVQGYPDVLEVLIHDYQDEFYWRAFAAPGEGESYLDHLRPLARKVAREDLVWSLCSHDHGCATSEGFGEKAAWIGGIIQYAQELGIRFLPVARFYSEMVERKPHQQQQHA